MKSAKQVVERNMAAFNAHDMDTYLSNQSPEVEFVFPGGITIRGRDQVRQYVQSQWSAFPDAHVEAIYQIATEDAAATEIILTATHTGPLSTPSGPIPPTGKRVTLRFASIHRVKNGLVASEHGYSDQFEFMTQLGLM